MISAQMSRPIRVIQSCKTLPQLDTAQRYAILWMERVGIKKDSVLALYILRIALAKANRLGRTPWKSVPELRIYSGKRNAYDDENRGTYD